MEDNNYLVNFIGKRVFVDKDFNNQPYSVIVEKAFHLQNVAAVVINDRYFLNYTDLEKNLVKDENGQ